MIQSEAQLETGLVKRLHSLGWDPVTITDGAGLRANLKAQLEAHHGVTLSDAEFNPHGGRGSGGQCVLPPAQGRIIRHSPVQVCQAQQAGHPSCRLPEAAP